MYFDTDDEEMVQVQGMFPIFGAPDTPLYQRQWPTLLPASFFDDLSDQPQAVRNYKEMSDGSYGRIPKERRDMWHNHVNYYLNGMIDADQHIGRVLDALEESGQADNTIIIFTSDHGEMAGAHHLRQKGSVAFKETVNVPLIIVDPRHTGECKNRSREFSPRPGTDNVGSCRSVSGATGKKVPVTQRAQPICFGS